MNYITFYYILDRNEVSPMSEKIVVVALGHSKGVGVVALIRNTRGDERLGFSVVSFKLN